MPKQGNRRRKTRTHKDNLEDEQKIGKSFIIHRKKVKGPMKEMVKNLREVMYPYTGMKLNESEKIRIKDYIKGCGVYGVSDMIILSSTEKHNYLKVIKTPHGPTLTFRIENYALIEDVLNSQRKVRSFPRTQQPAIVIMNGFNGEINNNQHSNIKNGLKSVINNTQLSLISNSLQSVFAPLNVARQLVSSLKRAVYIDYHHKTDSIYLRHYHIDSTPTNINKNLKRILKTNKVPDLSQFNDISEFFLNNHNQVSDSENDDLPQNLISFSTKSQISNRSLQNQQAIRLHEIGPRLKLKIIKIQEGVLTGNVLYHRYVQKTAEQILDQRTKVQKKIAEKEQRRKQMQEILNQKLEQKNMKKKFKNDSQDKNEQENDGSDQQQDLDDDYDLSDEYDYQTKKNVQKKQKKEEIQI